MADSVEVPAPQPRTFRRSFIVEADAVDAAPPAETPAETPAAEPEVVAEETPAEETPAEETPAEETPAEETPAEETPAEETPAEGEPPAEETPAEETPAEETPPEGTAIPEEVAQAAEEYKRIDNLARQDPEFALAYWQAEKRAGNPNADGPIAELQARIKPVQKPAEPAKPVAPVVPEKTDEEVEKEVDRLMKLGQDGKAQMLASEHANRKLLKPVLENMAAEKAKREEQEQQQQQEAVRQQRIRLQTQIDNNIRSEMQAVATDYPTLVEKDPKHPLGFRFKDKAVGAAVNQYNTWLAKSGAEQALGQLSLPQIVDTVLVQMGRAKDVKIRKKTPPPLSRGKPVAAPAGAKKPAAPAPTAARPGVKPGQGNVPLGVRRVSFLGQSS